MEKYLILVFNRVYMTNKTRHGQSLVEAIIAISDVMFLVTGLVAGTSASLKTSQRGRSRDQAVKLSDEGLEYARGLRDQNWTTFAALSGNYCFDTDAVNPLTSTVSDECDVKKTTADTVFTRQLRFTLSGTRMTVVSVTSYIEGTQKQNVTLTTYLTQWK
jgi:hypothetical protein